MSEPNTGVTGGTPPPASTSTPASTPGQTTQTPSATTQKIDFGMGGSSMGGATASPQATQQVSQTTEMFGDDWWKQYGDNVFKHPRIKEVLDYQRRYKEAEPIIKFAEDFGGLDNLQAFKKHLGPIWNYFNSLGDNASTRWKEFHPLLQKLVQGAPLTASEQQQVDNMEEGNPEIKKLNEELNGIKKKLSDRELNEVKGRRVDNVKRYENMMLTRMSEEKLPEDLRKIVAKFILADLPHNMPKDQQGRFTNAADTVSEDAFKTTWEQSVLGNLKVLEKYFFDKFSKGGGPTIPDTNASGKTPSNTQGYVGRDAKKERMVQFLQSGQ